MTVTHEVQLAMSADFLKAFARLPKQIQKKTRTWIDRFRANPDQASLNYESLAAMRDPKVRTSRIDQKYRAVLVHPEQGSVCLLVWVDNHDEAMAWAENKVFEVNRYTGTFQVYEPRDGGELTEARKPDGQHLDMVAAEPDVVPSGRLLAGHRDEDLLLLGVPEPLLPAVRALRTTADLDGLSPYLPQEASDSVYMLAAGYSVDEVLEEFDRKERGAALAAAEAVDIADVAAALERPSTMRQFKLVEDDQELAAMLAAPMDQWRIFLHPSQAKLVTMNSKGSARVLGGAGTGKTVVAMHRIRHLAREVFTAPDQRLLFTTYTANLAADIEANLRRLCGPEFERIDVKHLQEVARDVLAARGVKMPAVAYPKQMREAWRQAIDYSETEFPKIFYQEEWDKVVQAQDVVDLDEYLRARRAGRGQRLSRAQRKQVWEVLAEYRRALDTAGFCEHADIVREARMILQRGASGYVCVVADETQDFRTADLRLLRALVPEGPNDIFVVGDPHQRIYGHKASLSRCGISVRGRRSRKLRINYRTTQQIRNWAVARLEGMSFDDLDEGTDDLAGERSLRLGIVPEVEMFASQTEEVEAIVRWIHAWRTTDELAPASICVCARTGKLAQEYADALAERGVAVHVVETKAPDVADDKVRVATMHRVKGLEFSRVVLAGVRAQTLPFRDNAWDSRDETARELYIEGEKRLLYVAATRARDELRVTGWGQRSELV
jgi:hypothetical protein